MTWVDLGQNSTVNAVETNATGRIIGALTEWNGRIYIGYGEYFDNHPNAGVEVLSWDTAAAAYASTLGTFHSNANTSHRIINGELWMVANDMITGSSGQYAVIDSSHAYTEVTTSGLFSYHLFDSLYWGGNAFICGAGWFSSSVSSGDIWRLNSGTWTRVYTIGTSGAVRYYGMFELGGKLWAKSSNTNGMSQSTDGITWTTSAPTITTTQLCFPVTVSGAVLYRTQYEGTSGGGGVATALKRFDGTSETTAIASGCTSCVLDPNGTPYALVGTDIQVGNAAGSSWSTDQSSVPANGSALCVTDDAYYIGTTDSHVHRLWRNPDLVTDTGGHHPVTKLDGTLVTYQ